MDESTIRSIQADIDRCKQALDDAKGSQELYQTLISKYNSIFPNFGKQIIQSGKTAPVGTPFDFRPELNGIKENLEMRLNTIRETDPLYDFKEMVANDLKSLECTTFNPESMSLSEKKTLYGRVTATYHSYISNLGDGLYSYFSEAGFYDLEISESSLNHNLNQLYHKLKTFKALGYPIKSVPSKGPFVQITNKNENENKLEVNITFEGARDKIKSMSDLQKNEIDEILKKIDTIESIIKSEDHKNKKWGKASKILLWLADKGVDVAITLLPLFLRIQ